MRSSKSAVDEAIPIWRACIADGEPNSDDLANDLIFLAQIHRARDADDSARELLLEAERLIRGLPADERSDEHDALAECMVMLADLEKDLDMRLARLKEAAALTAALFADREADPSELLDRLVGVAEDLAELGHVDDAAQILKAAVARASALLSEQDDDLRMSLTDALEALAEVCVERDSPADVLKALQAAADLWRPRSMRLSKDQRDRFIEVLSALKEALTELGRRDEAQRIAVELRSLGARPR